MLVEAALHILHPLKADQLLGVGSTNPQHDPKHQVARSHVDGTATAGCPRTTRTQRAGNSLRTALESLVNCTTTLPSTFTTDKPA